MGIVGRDAAPGQQPVTARLRQGRRYCPRLGSRRCLRWCLRWCPRWCAAGWRTACGLAVGTGADSRLTVGY